MKFEELTESRVFSWIVICVLVAFCVFVSSRAWAGGTDVDVRQSNDMNNQTAGDIIGGDTSIGGDSSRAYGFSHSLGDVDINQCLGSTAWGTILFSRQKLELNLWCAASDYDSKGLYEMGARMRCKIEQVAEDFDTKADCIRANTVQVKPEPMLNIEIDEDEDERIEALYARVTHLEAERLAEAKKAEKAAQRAREAARRAERLALETQEAPVIVQQQIDENAARRAKARAALKGDK